jgi:hypothetical protein
MIRLTATNSRASGFSQVGLLSSRPRHRASYSVSVPCPRYPHGSDTRTVVVTVTVTVTVAGRQVSFVTNSPPTSGSLSAQPARGVAVATAFSLLAAGWVDDPSDYPLFYAFYQAPPNGTETMVAVASRDNSLQGIHLQMVGPFAAADAACACSTGASSVRHER